MTSKALSQGVFIIPKSSIEDAGRENRKSGRRHPSVYDAVAGRISTGGFIPNQLVVSSARDTASSSATALPPESVLFRTKSAPTRYAESDIYFSNERKFLPDLPESDLLKALHCYTSDFYSTTTSDRGLDDWKSFNETALIALGILMEETVLTTLGETGDLAFTEGERMIEPPPVAKRSTVVAMDGINSKGRRSKKRRVEIVD